MSYKILLIVMVLFPFAFSQSNVKIPTTTTKGSYVSFNQYNDSLKDSIKSFQIGNAWKVIGKCVLDTNKDLTLFVNKGKFYGNTGSSTDTLVINKMSADPLYQIFETSITVQFAPGAVPAVRPEWWGAKSDSVTSSSVAMQKALNTGLPVEGTGIYYCPTTLTVTAINIDSKTGFTFKGNSSAALFTCTTNKIKLNGVTIRNYTRVFERTVDQTPPPALDIEMQNCTVDSLTIGIFYFGDKTFNTSRAKINNNNFNNYANGILLYCNNYARNVDISNNIFTNAKRSTNNLSAIRIQTNLGSVSVPDTNTQDSSKCINICENIIDSIIGGNSSAGGYITGIMVLASRANIIGNVIKTVKNGYQGSIATSGNGYGIYTKLYDGIISDNNLWDAGSFAGITCKSEMLLSQSGYNNNGKSGRLTVSENKIHYEKITPTDNVSMRVHAENSIVADNTMTGRNAVLLLDSGEPNLPNNNNIVSGNLLISDSLVLMAVESDKTKIVDNMLRYNGAGAMKSPSDPGSVTEHVNRMLVFGCETSVKAVNHTYRDMEVSGNSISYDGAGSIFGIVGMEIEADTINYKNIKINNNLFYGIQYPIYLKNKYARWDSVAIHDNKIFTIVGTGTQLGYDSLSHISDVYVHDNYGMGASFSKKQTFSTTTTGVNRYVTLDSAGNFLWSAGLETAGQNMLMRSGNTLNIRTLRDSLNSFVYIMPKRYPPSGNTQIGLFSTDYQLDGTNYEALFINKGIAGPVQFKADKGGTGSYRNIELYTKNIRRALIDTNGLVSVDSSIWCGKYVMQQGIYGAVNIYDNSTAQSIPTGATYTKLTCFPSIGLNANVTCDTANDKITFTKTGKYRVSATLSFSCGTNNVEWRVAGFLNNVEQNQLHFIRKIGTAGDVGNAGITGFVNASTVPLDLDLRARHDNVGSVDLTVVYGNLNVEYVGE